MIYAMLGFDIVKYLCSDCTEYPYKKTHSNLVSLRSDQNVLILYMKTCTSNYT